MCQCLSILYTVYMPNFFLLSWPLECCLGCSWRRRGRNTIRSISWLFWPGCHAGVLKLCQHALEPLSIYSHNCFFNYTFTSLSIFICFSPNWKGSMLVLKCLAIFGPPCMFTFYIFLQINSNHFKFPQAKIKALQSKHNENGKQKLSWKSF